MKRAMGCLLAAVAALGLQAATVTRNIGSGTWDFNNTAFNSGGTLWTSNEDTAQFNLSAGGTVAVSSGVGARGILLSSGTWTLSGLDPFTFGPDGITYVGGLATFNLPFQYSGSASLPIVGNNNGGTLTFGNTLGASALSITKPSGLVLRFDYSTTDAVKFQSGAALSSVGNSTVQFFGGTSGETFGTLSGGSGTLTVQHWTNNTGLIQIGTIQRVDGLGSVHLLNDYNLATARPFRITGMQNTNGFIAPWVTVCFGPVAWSPRFGKIEANGTVEKIVSSTKRQTQWVSGLNAVIDMQGLESAYKVPACTVNSLALSPYNPAQNGSMNLFGSDITIESGGLLKTDGSPVMSNGTLRAGSEGRFYVHAFTTFDTENFFGPNAAGVLPEIVKFQSNNLLLKNPTNQFSGFSLMGGAVYLNGNRTPQAIGPVYMNPGTVFWVTNSAPVFGAVAVGQNATIGLTNCVAATFGSIDMGVNTDLRIQGTPKATLAGFSGIGWLNAVNLGSTFELAFSGPAVVTNANINITAPSGITIRTVGDTWMAGVNGLDAAVPITLTGPANSTNGIKNLTLGAWYGGRTLTFTGGCWPFRVFDGTVNGTVVIQDGARVVLTNGQTITAGGQMTIRNGGSLTSEWGTFGWGAGAAACVQTTNVLTI